MRCAHRLTKGLKLPQNSSYLPYTSRLLSTRLAEQHRLYPTSSAKDTVSHDHEGRGASPAQHLGEERVIADRGGGRGSCAGRDGGKNVRFETTTPRVDQSQRNAKPKENRPTSLLFLGNAKSSEVQTRPSSCFSSFRPLVRHILGLNLVLLTAGRLAVFQMFHAGAWFFLYRR